MKEVISDVFNRWKENKVEGWFMQVIGGEPFLIRWVQGKGLPRKRIELVDKGRWVELRMVDENVILRYIKEKFNSEEMYKVMVAYVKNERPTEGEKFISNLPVDDSRAGESFIVT